MFRKNIASALVIAIALSTFFLVTGCDDTEKVTETKTPAVKTPVVKPVVAHASVPAIAKKVLISTSMGDITVELYAEKAPITTKNFLAYVDSGFYNNTIFHRVKNNFMIQCGGFTAELARKQTLGPIINEAYNKVGNTRGSLAMARTSDVNSATSQFFINHRDNHFLDGNGVTGGYAVFGRVISGMDVVDEIAVVKTTSKNGMDDVPVEQVVINSITVIK